MKKETKLTIEIGMLANDIKCCMMIGEEQEAYDKLGVLNSRLSDLNGEVLQMEEVLAI